MISVDRAGAILSKAAGRRILVLGDLMLDRYVSGSVDRISPEAPVPVVHVQDEHCLPGGAANVARSIQSLGGQAVVVGAMGTDAASDALLKALGEEGVDTSGVVRDSRVTTSEKTRILAENQQVVRVDREDTPEALGVTQGELVARLEDLARANVDGIIIEDYGKGVVTQETVGQTTRLASALDVPVGLDPKDNHELDFEALTFATPNYREACWAAGVVCTPMTEHPGEHPQLKQAASALLEKWHAGFLVITLGSHGMYLVGREEDAVVIPTKAREVFDVCGAGDTVIAATMLCLSAGADHREAASLANQAAGVVVGKIGVATCTPEELLGSME